MQKNARQILCFFIAVITIIILRIVLVLVYDILTIASFDLFNNQDSLVEVLLINLTELSLILIITHSLKQTIIKYKEYQKSQINLLRSSSVSNEAMMASLKYDTGDDQNQSQVPITIFQDEVRLEEDTPQTNEAPASTYANQLLRKIEEDQGLSGRGGDRSRNVFSANDNIRSIFIPRESVRNDDGFLPQQNIQTQGHISQNLMRVSSQLSSNPPTHKSQTLLTSNNRMPSRLLLDQVSENEDCEIQFQENAAKESLIKRSC